MSRSIKKGAYVAHYLQKKVDKLNESGKKETLKTWSRRSTVTPDFIGHTFAVHNGNKFIPVFVTESMVGHKLGEFSITRIFKGHTSKKKITDNMEAAAKLRNVPISSRKIGILANLIRGHSVAKSLAMLQHKSQECAVQLRKLLLSAISNWQQHYEGIPLEEARLFIQKITVDRAGMLKRVRPASRGRAHRVRKRSSHVTIVLSSLNKPGLASSEAEEVVMEKT